jgi:ketosteroid isomerase-like protein
MMICYLFCYSCSNTGKTPVDQKTIDEVTALLTRYSNGWVEAIKNKDASTVTDYFSPELVFHIPTGAIIDKEGLVKDINENPVTLKSFLLKDLNVKLFGTDIANVTAGGVRIWMDTYGNEQTLEERYTNVWKKNSGKWQCIIGHANVLQYGTPETDLAKIKAIPAKAEEAINSNNFEAWLDLMDENAQVMFIDNKTLYGKEEMSRELKKYWVNVESDYTLNHTETRLMGDYAYGIGDVTGQEKDLKTGQVTKIHSRELDIFRKQNDGEWKVFRILVNQNK